MILARKAAQIGRQRRGTGRALSFKNLTASLRIVYRNVLQASRALLESCSLIRSSHLVRNIKLITRTQINQMFENRAAIKMLQKMVPRRALLMAQKLYRFPMSAANFLFDTHE